MCRGRVWGVCRGRVGVCVGCVLGRVSGRMSERVLGVSGVRVGAVGESKYRSPLYYLDTLVNPDTCLGRHDK